MNIPLLDKFPVDALIFQKRGVSLHPYSDKARYINHKGEQYYELKSNKTKFRPSSFDNMLPQVNGRPLILLYEYQRGMLAPVDVSNLEEIYERDALGNVLQEKVTRKDGTEVYENKIKEVVNLKAVEEDMAFWGQQFRRQAELKYKTKGFWEQYMPFILMGMTFIFYVILTYYFSQAISDSSMNVVDALNRLMLPAPPG